MRILLSALLCGGVVLAQGGVGDEKRVGDRAAASYGLEPRVRLRCDGAQLPEIKLTGDPVWIARLWFQADSRRLLVCYEGVAVAGQGPTRFVFAVDCASGAFEDITPADAARCVGATMQGPLLFDGGRLRAPGDDGLRSPELPERSDFHVSPFRQQVVVCSFDRSLQTSLIDLAGDGRHALSMSRSLPSAVAFASNGRVAIARAMAAAGGELTSEGIRVFDEQGKVLADLPPARSAVRVLAFSATGDRLVYVDDRVRLVALPGGEPIADADFRPNYWSTLDEHTAISLDADSARLHNARTLTVVKDFPVDIDDRKWDPAMAKLIGGLLRAATSPDGKLVAVANGSSLRIFGITRRE